MKEIKQMKWYKDTLAVMQPESDLGHRGSIPLNTKWDTTMRGNSMDTRGDKGEDKRK